MVRDELSDEDILNLLEEITNYIGSNPPENLTFKTITLREEGFFQVLAHGWINSHRIHTSVLHVEFVGGKVQIYHDGTDIDVMGWLLDRGVSKQSFELVHLPPEELALL